MASPEYHNGVVKWYNFKTGYGFIEDHLTGTDVFVHFSGLTRSLRKRLPREGDKLLVKSNRETRDLRPEKFGGMSTTPPTNSRIKNIIPVTVLIGYRGCDDITLTSRAKAANHKTVFAFPLAEEVT
ncbi:Cold shock protein 1 [Portunus trituberculatus]|uniref:Cold shock protein 1 n=1 Tax=Portunus trituberculatus TaxID=210409 RepID=A0A5B7G672_PORTR|nr:Cold shock protein 1 [Portunus trituberculatus]